MDRTERWPLPEQVLDTRRCASSVLGVPDFRADPSDSPEGKGHARRAWDSYAAAVQRVAEPLVDPVAGLVARRVTEDLMGFWVMWHLCGGFEGLERYGMHKSTIWRKVKKFRIATGHHPDEFKFVGVHVDREAAWGDLARHAAPGSSQAG